MENKRINYSLILQLILKRKFLYVKPLIIVTILSAIYIFSLPRYYTCQVKLAPEYDLGGMSTLSSLASSFGFDIGNQATTDAISPTLYPDLISSNKFLVKMFDIKVKDSGNTISTSYYDYLKNHQQHPWWQHITSWIKGLFTTPGAQSKEVNPFHLTKEQWNIVQEINDNIKCKTDKKTDVITITVTDQDANICACLADSVRQRLQDFITDYRTSKARVDLKYYKELASKAHDDYQRARQVYATYCDVNQDVTLQSFRSKQEDLENEMQMKYNIYTTMHTQLQAAQAKVQQKTPAFTVLQDASIPIKPAGPKRVFFIIGMIMLTTIGVSIYILKDIIKESI